MLHKFTFHRETERAPYQSSCPDFLSFFARVLMRQTNQKTAMIVMNDAASTIQTIVWTCSLSARFIPACALPASNAAHARENHVIRFILPPLTMNYCDAGL